MLRSSERNSNKICSCALAWGGSIETLADPLVARSLRLSDASKRQQMSEGLLVARAGPSLGMPGDHEVSWGRVRTCVYRKPYPEFLSDRIG
jgi:hypothetical protein